jgi:hypothetical protein
MLIMTKHLEWDFDNPAHRRRRPRVEVLGPEEPLRARLDVTITRHRSMPPWMMPVAIIVAVLLLWRYGFALLIAGLMLAALVGREAIEAAIFVAAILAVLAWRDRRAGRPF